MVDLNKTIKQLLKEYTEDEIHTALTEEADKNINLKKVRQEWAKTMYYNTRTSLPYLDATKSYYDYKAERKTIAYVQKNYGQLTTGGLYTNKFQIIFEIDESTGNIKGKVNFDKNPIPKIKNTSKGIVLTSKYDDYEVIDIYDGTRDMNMIKEIMGK